MTSRLAYKHCKVSQFVSGWLQSEAISHLNTCVCFCIECPSHTWHDLEVEMFHICKSFTSKVTLWSYPYLVSCADKFCSLLAVFLLTSSLNHEETNCFLLKKKKTSGCVCFSPVRHCEWWWRHQWFKVALQDRAKPPLFHTHAVLSFLTR